MTNKLFMLASYFQVIFECKGKMFLGQVGLCEEQTGNLVKAACFPRDEPHKFRLLILNQHQKNRIPEISPFCFGFIG